MKSLSGKLGIVLSVVGLLIIGYLAKGYVEFRTQNIELRTQNEELRKKLDEFKSKDEARSNEIVTEAIGALKKLRSLIQAGISYENYTPALGEALYRANLFLEGPEATKRPQLAKSIVKVVNHYIMVKEVWGFMVTNQINLFPREDDPLWQKIRSTYPGAKWDDIRYTLNHLILREASEELEMASNLLLQP